MVMAASGKKVNVAHANGLLAMLEILTSEMSYHERLFEGIKELELVIASKELNETQKQDAYSLLGAMKKAVESSIPMKLLMENMYQKVQGKITELTQLMKERAEFIKEKEAFEKSVKDMKDMKEDVSYLDEIDSLKDVTELENDLKDVIARMEKNELLTSSEWDRLLELEEIKEANSEMGKGGPLTSRQADILIKYEASKELKELKSKKEKGEVLTPQQQEVLLKYEQLRMNRKDVEQAAKIKELIESQGIFDLLTEQVHGQSFLQEMTNLLPSYCAGKDDISRLLPAVEKNIDDKKMFSGGRHIYMGITPNVFSFCSGSFQRTMRILMPLEELQSQLQTAGKLSLVTALNEPITAVKSLIIYQDNSIELDEVSIYGASNKKMSVDFDKLKTVEDVTISVSSKYQKLLKEKIAAEDELDLKPIPSKVVELKKLIAKREVLLNKIEKNLVASNVYLMALPSNKEFKPSDPHNLYLYRTPEDKIVYYVNGNPDPQQIYGIDISEATFDSTNEKLTKCNDEKITWTAINTALRTGHIKLELKETLKNELDPLVKKMDGKRKLGSKKTKFEVHIKEVFDAAVKLEDAVIRLLNKKPLTDNAMEKITELHKKFHDKYKALSEDEKRLSTIFSNLDVEHYRIAEAVISKARQIQVPTVKPFPEYLIKLSKQQFIDPDRIHDNLVEVFKNNLSGFKVVQSSDLMVHISDRYGNELIEIQLGKDDVLSVKLKGKGLLTEAEYAALDEAKQKVLTTVKFDLKLEELRDLTSKIDSKQQEIKEKILAERLKVDGLYKEKDIVLLQPSQDPYIKEQFANIAKLKEPAGILYQKWERFSSKNKVSNGTSQTYHDVQTKLYGDFTLKIDSMINATRDLVIMQAQMKRLDDIKNNLSKSLKNEKENSDLYIELHKEGSPLRNSIERKIIQDAINNVKGQYPSLDTQSQEFSALVDREAKKLRENVDKEIQDYLKNSVAFDNKLNEQLSKSIDEEMRSLKSKIAVQEKDVAKMDRELVGMTRDRIVAFASLESIQNLTPKEKADLLIEQFKFEVAQEIKRLDAVPQLHLVLADIKRLQSNDMGAHEKIKELRDLMQKYDKLIDNSFFREMHHGFKACYSAIEKDFMQQRKNLHNEKVSLKDTLPPHLGSGDKLTSTIAERMSNFCEKMQQNYEKRSDLLVGEEHTRNRGLHEAYKHANDSCLLIAVHLKKAEQSPASSSQHKEAMAQALEETHKALKNGLPDEAKHFLNEVSKRLIKEVHPHAGFFDRRQIHKTLGATNDNQLQDHKKKIM